jgi:hypothetical protein
MRLCSFLIAIARKHTEDLFVQQQAAWMAEVTHLRVN